MSEGQPESVQPYHKEDTTSAHESANITSEEGTSVSATEDCSSDNSASMILKDIANDNSDSVSDIESLVKLLWIKTISIQLRRVFKKWKLRKTLQKLKLLSLHLQKVG